LRRDRRCDSLQFLFELIKASSERLYTDLPLLRRSHNSEVKAVMTAMLLFSVLGKFVVHLGYAYVNFVGPPILVLYYSA